MFNGSSTYGYSKFTSRGGYVRAVEGLYRNQVLPLVRLGLCAAIFTQLSDVEDETNGLVSYGRRVEKLEQTGMLTVSQELFRVFQESL